MADSAEHFLRRLHQSGLYSDAMSAAFSDVSRLKTADDAAQELVARQLLTDYQSDVLLKGESVPLVIGEYVVLDVIGRGGMGLVLKGQHVRMKRLVAIKFLLNSMTPTAEIQQRFEREVQAAAQLHHPNIVAAYDAGVHRDGSHYLVMQYVEGQNLSELVRSVGPLAIPLAVNVISQAAAGLGYAHDRGIVHRDVKPGNLLIDHEGVVRVLDLGLARFKSAADSSMDANSNPELTGSGTVMGTIDYMAPEQALDARSADQLADIYSLGCTLYFLLTGNPPFQSDTVMRRLLAHRSSSIPQIRSVRPEAPAELERIFARMMAKKPADRPQSMQDLVHELASLNLSDASADRMETLDQASGSRGGGGPLGRLAADGGPRPPRAADNEPILQMPPVDSALDLPRSSQKPSPDPPHRSASTAVRDTAASARSIAPAPVTDRGDAKTDRTERSASRSNRRRSEADPETVNGSNPDTDGSSSTSSRPSRTDRSKTRNDRPLTQRRTRTKHRSGRSSAAAPTSDGQSTTLSMSAVERWLRDSTWGIPRFLLAAGSCLLLLIVFAIISSSPPPDELITDADSIVVVDDSNPLRSRRSSSATNQQPKDFSLDFDGVDDFATMPALDVGNTTALTIDALITPVGGGSDSRATVIQFSNTTRMFVEKETASWRLGCTFQNNAGKLVESLSEQRHPYGTEHHVAIVWNASVVKTYVNGVDQTAWRFLNGALANTRGALRIGSDLGGRTVYRGRIDDLRISSQAIFDTAFPAPVAIRSDDSSTVALYRCDEGSGRALLDSSKRKQHATLVGPTWVPAQRTAVSTSTFQHSPSDPPPHRGLKVKSLTELNTPQSEAYCWVSPGGLSIYYTREGSGVSQPGIWRAERRTVDMPFGEPRFQTEMKQIALSGDELNVIAVPGFGAPPLLSQVRRGFKQITLMDFQPIQMFRSNRGVESPWLSTDGLLLLFKREDIGGQYPGRARFGVRSEFVVSERSTVYQEWAVPSPLPLEDSPLLTGMLTWPMMTTDRRTLFFCNMSGSDSEIMVATRDNPHDSFTRAMPVLVDGSPLLGRAPRFVETTGELYFSRLTTGTQSDWDLAVVRGLDPSIWH